MPRNPFRIAAALDPRTPKDARRKAGMTKLSTVAGARWRAGLERERRVYLENILSAAGVVSEAQAAAATDDELEALFAARLNR